MNISTQNFLVKMTVEAFQIHFSFFFSFICFCFSFSAGYYVYIETSSPRVLYDRAILKFKGVNRKTVCLSFYYHMYGVHVRALNLYNGGSKIWNMKGDQGDSWKRAEVTISGDYDVS